MVRDIDHAEIVIVPDRHTPTVTDAEIDAADRLTPNRVPGERGACIREQHERERRGSYGFEDAAWSEGSAMIPPAPQSEANGANRRRASEDERPEEKDEADSHSVSCDYRMTTPVVN